jgi:hypothetical protein
MIFLYNRICMYLYDSERLETILYGLNVSNN